MNSVEYNNVDGLLYSSVSAQGSTSNLVCSIFLLSFLIFFILFFCFVKCKTSFIVFLSDLRCLDVEKERHDMSSPRGVLEACFKRLDLETSSSKDSPRDAESRRDSRAVSHWRGFFNQWKRKSMRRFASFPPLSVPKIPRRKSTSMKENEHPVLDSALGSNLYNWKYSWRNFTLSELQTATNNFSHGLLVVHTFTATT